MDFVLCAVKEVTDERGNFQAFRPEFMVARYEPKLQGYGLLAGFFDPSSQARYYADDAWDLQNRISLAENYRNNSQETSDVGRLDLDGDPKKDPILYSLHKNSQGKFVCAVTVTLSKSKRSLRFSSRPPPEKQLTLSSAFLETSD